MQRMHARQHNPHLLKRMTGLYLPAAVLLLLLSGWAFGAAFIAVVPDQAIDSDGNRATTTPFGASSECADGFRYQQVIEGDRVGGGRISAIAFRLDASEPGDVGPLTFPGSMVRLASTAASPTTISSVFDNNLGADTTVVFTGDLVASATAGGSPTAFDFEIPIEAPFDFDPADGNLLIELTAENCPPGVSAEFDADNRGLGHAVAWDHASSTADQVATRGLVTQLLLVSGSGVIAPLYNCPANSSSGDNLTRGFYVENFPARELDKVTMTYHMPAAGTYTVRMTARENTYDGRIIGGPRTRTFNTGTGGTRAEITFDFGSATVTEGSTVTFSQELLDSPSGSLFYNVGDGPCADIVQTEGTTPPLDTVRRDRVAVTIEAETRIRGIGGNWSVVGHDGEGFMIDVTQHDGTLVVIWFTYDFDGNQMWLIGTDPDFSGNSAHMTLSRVTGPSFGPDFSPADVITESWGTLTIVFEDCGGGRVTFNSLAGFGAGAYDIMRVYETEQASCP